MPAKVPPSSQQASSEKVGNGASGLSSMFIKEIINSQNLHLEDKSEGHFSGSSNHFAFSYRRKAAARITWVTLQTYKFPTITHSPTLHPVLSHRIYSKVAHAMSQDFPICTAPSWNLSRGFHKLLISSLSPRDLLNKCYVINYCIALFN